MEGIDTMTTAASNEPAFFRGVWIQPEHPDYRTARKVFNQRADPWPKVVARCAGVADVVAAVRYAREHGLRIDVRSTGYNLGGLAAGNEMVIDLSLMRAVQILPEQRIARIQGGVRGGDLQIEAAPHRLAAATGALSGTGVGLMLGGGVGHLAARAGYATDNILSVELVIATGEVVTASPEQNPDLFWAVRGSTGNFGVVTALEVRLHDVPPLVHLAVMSWSLDNVAGGVEALRTSWEWASDDCNLLAELGVTALDGRGGLDVIVTHVGSEEQARADLARLRSFGAPDEEMVSVMPYRDVHFFFNDSYPPSRTFMIEQPVTDFGDKLLDVFIERVREPAGRGRRGIETIPRLGALGRAPDLPSALRETGEEPTWMVVPGCWWDDASEDEAHLAWTESVVEDIRRIGPVADRAQPNTVTQPLDLDGLGWLYGDRLRRLRELKHRWDPDNAFRGSHNIPPADA
jgi:FAD/FMN-containing dehydrogenase